MPPALDSFQVDELGNGTGVELRKKRKREYSTPSGTVEEVETGSGVESQVEKKRKKDLNTSQMVQEVGTGNGVESQGKRKKEKKKDSTLSQTVEGVGTGSGVEIQGKRKKEKKRESAISQTVEEVGTGSGVEIQGKRKKEKKRESAISQTVEVVGTGSGVEIQGKRKKEKKRESAISQTVEEAGIGSGIELLGKRKKEKKRESITSQTIEEAGIGSGIELQGKRKKEKKREPIPAGTIEEVGNGNGVELHGKKEKGKRKKRELTALATVGDVDEAGIGSGGESQRKRKKKEKNLTTSQNVEDCGPGTGSAKKTILITQELQTGNDSESVRKKKKKVTFELPDSTQDDPTENAVLGEQSPWATDRLRPDLVWGLYTPEEDGALKQAIFDYIQDQGWDREYGLQQILNSHRTEAKGCWYIIRKCLPQRELKRLYSRAHRLFDPGNYLGKWTSEETESLIELHSVHGNDWKKISSIIGRDATNCKDKWRQIKLSCSNDQNRGPWSKEEHQKLCALVLKCLHVKAQMAKRGLLKKHHKVVRDDINWEFIAEQMDGRNRLQCLNQWYRRMASPMVTTGEWSSGDDQRLLGRLTEEFPLSEELIEWDSLLEHRSGEVCKRRWEQMQRSIGRGPALRQLHFLEKLENVVTRFAPHLLDTEYDQQFAAELQQADADESL